MKNNEFKKLTIDSEKLPISWQKQRVDINTKISEVIEPKRRFILIHRWVDIAVLIVICVIAGWFLVSHSIAPKEEVVATEEVFTEEGLPASLVVLNDFDTEETDYEEFFDFMVP